MNTEVKKRAGPSDRVVSDLAVFRHPDRYPERAQELGIDYKMIPETEPGGTRYKYRKWEVGVDGVVSQVSRPGD